MGSDASAAPGRLTRAQVGAGLPKACSAPRCPRRRRAGRCRPWGDPPVFIVTEDGPGKMQVPHLPRVTSHAAVTGAP